MENGNIYEGHTIPLQPSAACITELLRNGSTQEEIYHMQSNAPWTHPMPSGSLLALFSRMGMSQEAIDQEVNRLKNQLEQFEDLSTESPLDLYKGGVGYRFKWGHIVENYGAPDEDTPCFTVSWDVCLDEILSKAHNFGMHLDQLCYLCERFLYSLDHRSWPVFIADGADMSSFQLYSQASINSDCASQELADTRIWVATEFLEKILPALLTYLTGALENEIPDFNAQVDPV